MPRLRRGAVDDLRAQARADTATLPPAEYPMSRRNEPVSRCKNCFAPIWWRLNPSGKRQPMNYDLVTAQPTGRTAPRDLRCEETLMADSAIEWTNKTWNPTVGCDKVSAGCTNCYAMRLANRLVEPFDRRARIDLALATTGHELEFPTEWLDDALELVATDISNHAFGVRTNAGQVAATELLFPALPRG